MSSRRRRPCDGNVGWPVRNEEDDEDEDEEASEEVEEVEEQDEEAAEAAEDDEEGYDDIDSVEENEEEVKLTVEVVENESERDSESQASHPTPSQTQHITHRARGGNLESKRPEESPASAAATATPSTSGSAQDGKTRLPLKWEIHRMPLRLELALGVYQLGKGKTHWHDNTSLNFEANLRIRDAP
eukprot:g73883.t1